MALLVVVFFGLYSLMIRNNRKISLIFVAFMSYIFIVTPIRYNSDYNTYQHIYNHQVKYVNTFERGYSFFQSIMYNIGLSFTSFRMILIIAAMICLWVGILRFTRNPLMVFIMYFITVFAFDIVQYRNFMMISLVILGYSMLKSDKLLIKLLSFVFVYLSGQFHASGYIFMIGLILYFSKIKFSKKFILVILVSVLVLFIGIKFLIELPIFKGIILNFASFTGRGSILTEKINSTFTTGYSIKIIIAYTILILLSFVFLRLNKDMWTKDIGVLIYGYSTSLIGLLLMGLAPDYSRIIRNSSIFLFIIISKIYSDNFKIISMKNRRLVWNIILICLILILLVFITDKSWGPVMANNVQYLLHYVNS